MDLKSSIKSISKNLDPALDNSRKIIEENNNSPIFFETSRNLKENEINMNSIFKNSIMEKSNQSFIQTKILKITIENSPTLQKGKEIFIGPNGLFDKNSSDINSIKNNENENIRINEKNNVNFGYFKDEKNRKLLNFILPPEKINYNNKNNNNNNDDDENESEKEKENSQEGLFFKIYYNFISKKYYIKDLGNGFGTFIKLKDKFYIIDNSLINIGDSYLLFSYNKPESDGNINEQIENLNNNRILYCQPYNGDKKYETIIFQNYVKNYFTIGRKEDCDLNIQDKMLSKIHCLLVYSEEEGWYIIDGDEYGNHSTNGTWIFAFDDIELLNGMYFKSNSHLFSVCYE
jgi:pSer/pThr/pTyr-binding forkhead associated (FHA) protein